MALTLGPLLVDAGIDPPDALVIRHTYVREHEESGLRGIHADSTGAEILEYTRSQSPDPRRFPIAPAPFWVVFIREGGDRARLWSVVENRGEVDRTEHLHMFDLVQSPRMDDLWDRLVVGWRSPRTWRMNATTAASYPVVEIADAEPVPFPGFDRLVLNYEQLQAVGRLMQ